MELVYLVTELAWSPRSLEVSPGASASWVVSPWGLGATQAQGVGGSPRWPDRPLVPPGTKDALVVKQKISISQGKLVYVHREKPSCGGGKALQPPTWER